RDLFITRPAEPPLKLIRAAASVDEMRVTIHQSGCNPGLPEIALAMRSRHEIGRNPILGADPNDAFPAHRDSPRRNKIPRVAGWANARVAPQRQGVRSAHSLLSSGSFRRCASAVFVASG